MHPPLRRQQGSRRQQSSRRQQGSALIVTMMLLIVMIGMAMTSLDATTRDRQVAGYQSQSISSFYAAEAGAAEARNLVRGLGERSETPDFYAADAPATLGDAGIYQHGAPGYYGDPSIAPDPPIRYVGDGDPYSNGGNLQIGGQQFVETRWQINVVGTTPAGAASRVEVMATKILSKGY
jgi:hypothetical protein